MPKFNLSEAAKAILANEGAKETLDSSVASKRGGQDKPQKLPATVQGDVGKIGDDPEMQKDPMPQFTKGVPSATPPGATPPVSSQPMEKLKGQPQETMGAGKEAVQQAATDYSSIRDRIKAKLAPQTMKPNPGATFQSYGEETETDEEVVAEEKEEKGHEDAAQDKALIKKMMKKEKMKEDIDALLSGENLSEEFVNRATTIFEAAVYARAEEVIAEAQEVMFEEFEAAVEEIKEDLATKVDDYLNYMVEEWMKENEIAIETGLRAEIAEDFMTGLRDLFIEHHIDIPEDKVNVVEELTSKIEELESALNEEMNSNVQLTKQITEQVKLEAIHTACEGLTQTQVEKLKSLAEGVEYTTEEEFVAKLETLKESYFKTEVKVADSSYLNEEIQIEEEKKPVSASPDMNLYAQTISKTLVK
jgi:hypothetical protein